MLTRLLNSLTRH